MAMILILVAIAMIRTLVPVLTAVADPVSGRSMVICAGMVGHGRIALAIVVCRTISISRGIVVALSCCRCRARAVVVPRAIRMSRGIVVAVS